MANFIDEYLDEDLPKKERPATTNIASKEDDDVENMKLRLNNANDFLSKNTKMAVPAPAFPGSQVSKVPPRSAQGRLQPDEDDEINQIIGNALDSPKDEVYKFYKNKIEEGKISS